MKLCNLFLYKVKNVPYNSVCSQGGGNVKEGIIKSLSIECTDKLYFYEFKSNCQFLPLDDDVYLSDESTIVVVDMHCLGISSLNKDSFDDSLDTVGEKHEALSLFCSFHQKIVSEKNLRGKLAIDCRNNRSIEKHLDTSYHNSAHSQLLDSLPNLKEKPLSSQCDHLISVSEHLNQQTCSVLSREISLHNWIEILHQGGNVKRSVEVPKSLPVDVTISSDIFDQCLAWDSGQSGSNLSLLGEGGFAKTFKYDIAIQSNFIVSVVIKQNSSRDKKNDEKPAWYREACHTRRICHDKIIRYFDKPILYRRYYYCIMEYGGISLHDKYYHNESNANMDLKDIATAMLHIADAINYLHNHMDNVIIHRDIRSSNVLVSERNVYKLIDFGISSEKIKEQSAIHSDVHFGNPLWKSPEYCRYLLGRRDSRGELVGPRRKSDVWMFGVFAMEMLSFPEYPGYFVEYSNDMFRGAFLRDLADEKIDLVSYLNNNCDTAIKEIVGKCLKYSEDQRVDSEQLLKLCEGLQQ